MSASTESSAPAAAETAAPRFLPGCGCYHLTADPANLEASSGLPRWLCVIALDQAYERGRRRGELEGLRKAAAYARSAMVLGASRAAGLMRRGVREAVEAIESRLFREDGHHGD